MKVTIDTEALPAIPDELLLKWHDEAYELAVHWRIGGNATGYVAGKIAEWYKDYFQKHTDVQADVQAEVHTECVE